MNYELEAAASTQRPPMAPAIMEISPGPISFGFVSTFLSLITTEELPYDSLRAVIHDANLTLIDFAANAIEIETGFIAIMCAFVALALLPCLTTCAWCCGKRPSVEDVERASRSGSAHSHADEQASLDCRKRAAVTTLWLAFIVVVLSDLCMFYTNARIESTLDAVPDIVKSSVHDLEFFVKDTHSQIKYKLENGFHISVEKVIKDLEDVDVLLGVPIQSEVAAHTGIELAFDSLATISLANAELVYRVLMLQETIARALKISQEAATRMEELQIQLSVLQRQCTYRDRPLCDTLRIRSFEENGVVDVLKTLQEDQSIFRLRYLGEIETGSTVRNISSEVGISRSMFGNFPQQVKRDTSYQRNYTLEQLESIRHRTTTNAQMLTATVNGLLQRLQGTWESVEPKYEQLKELSFIYRNIGWLVALVIIWVLLLVLMAYCCLLCESHTKAGAMFLIAAIIICISSVAIGLYGVVSLAIGGNAEVFLCRSLYDKTNRAGANERFNALGKLLDRPGYMYAQEPHMGIMGELLRPEDVNRTYVNVSLASVLRGCEENRASYNVFQLDAFVNTTQISHLKNFSKVTTAIDAITVSERTLLTLTQSVQNILENMLQTSAFNLTAYRNSIGAPTPEKDLATFIDQMQRVALQIQDVATSSRMATLGSRAKRLQSSILQPLEQLQNEILYHLTALELQKGPWAKQVNQTLSHLRNIQEYLEIAAGEICHNQTRMYTERLKQLLTSSGASLSSQLGETTAKCQPFFDIFDANRLSLCGNIVDNVNALWFFALLILLLFSIATPVGLNIITIQRHMHALQRAQQRRNDRSPDRDRRDDRRSRSASATRERSASRQRPPIKRSATEETLELGDDDRATPPRDDDRRMRGRSVARLPNMSTPSTPTHTRASAASSGQLRRSGTDARRSASRNESQAKTTKKKLQKQNTESFELDESEQWQSQDRLHLRGGRSKQRGRLSDRESQERDHERSITPVMPCNPDVQPATPLARTPTRLRNRMSLTTRAVANIVRGGSTTNPASTNTATRNQLQRGDTEDYDMDNDSEMYGETGLASNTLYNMRHTPPAAPPPPPPPGPTSNLFRRY